jgi:endonuclease YncB( thermonuclease family)
VKSWLSSLALLGLGIVAGWLIVLSGDRPAPAPPGPVAEALLPPRPGPTVLRIETKPDAEDAEPTDPPDAAPPAAPPIAPGAAGTAAVLAVPPAALPSPQPSPLPEVQVRQRQAQLVPVPPPEPGTRPRPEQGGGDQSLGQVAARSAAPTDVPPPRPVAGRADISGAARAVDGETLDVGGTRVRLFGIGAPDPRQDCTRGDGGRWRCGQEARTGLSQLLPAGTVVRCTPRAEDDKGVVHAVCFDGQGVDLAARQVIGGHALALRGISLDYVDQESIARAARRGMWAGDFERPWEWKRNNPAP